MSGFLETLAQGVKNKLDPEKLQALMQTLDSQSFRPNDSLILSTVNHPVDAVGEFGKWLTKNVNTAAGIPDQYDNPYPLLAPQGQEQAAFDIAGMAQLGSMPFAPKSAGGTLGTFIGPKASTWDANRAATASKMLDDGVDPAQVWREHLIGRMPDKSLFSEVSDSGVNFAVSPVDEKYNKMSIGRAINHKDLFTNYPENWETKIHFTDGGAGSYGNDVVKVGVDDAPYPISTTLHELQHAIQQREGWARGGSPEQFRQEINYTADSTPSLYELLNLIETKTGNTVDFSPSMLNDVSDTSVFLDELTSGLDRKTIDSFLTKQDVRNFKKQGYDFGRDTELGTVLDVLSSNARSEIDSIKAGDSPLKQYLKLTGEAQARATQDRLNMDMQQRRENYPLAGDKLSDIPLEQLIYRYGDNGPSMSVNRGDYVGEHMAPLKDSGAPLHNLTANDNAIYPDDVYSSRAADYYGSGEPEDAQIFRMARYLKDKPLEKVSMYRAIPDPNYDISKQVKELEKIGLYKNKFGFFPNQNSIVDELYSKHNVDGVSYDQAQKNMLDEVYSRIAELDSKKQKTPGINHGDWVALDRKYAKEHGESALNGKYKIVSKKAPAKQLFTNGDSIREWGWDSTAARLLPATMLGYGMANQEQDPLTWALTPK